MYKKIGILGFGEVGKAMSRFYKKPLIRDIDKNEFVKPLDILHVCLPFNKSFIKIVSQNIIDYKPEVVIIHSTVSVGTTLKLYKKFGNVVHSPIRGIHPNLYEGIKTFVKFVGSDDLQLGKFVVRHLNDIGIKAEVLGNSCLTEMAKLLDTTYYGLCIAFHDYADKLCDKQSMNYEAVMTRYNETYNDGYAKLGMQNVIRPILYSPKGRGIKGHCVLENTILLHKQYGSHNILNTVLQLGKNSNIITEFKPYLDKTWLYCEYYGKGRTFSDIGRQFNVTYENILAIAHRRGIKPKKSRWTEEENNQLKELSQVKTFKEIASILNRSYAAIRTQAIKLSIESIYNPSEETKKEDIRKKMVYI